MRLNESPLLANAMLRRFFVLLAMSCMRLNESPLLANAMLRRLFVLPAM